MVAVARAVIRLAFVIPLTVLLNTLVVPLLPFSFSPVTVPVPAVMPLIVLPEIVLFGPVNGPEPLLWFIPVKPVVTCEGNIGKRIIVTDYS